MGITGASHGGSDGGASANGIVEKDYTLKISKYISDRLNELGIESKLTRDTDVNLEPNERVEKALALFGNDKDVIVLSNHINAGGGDGAEIIYSLRNNDTLSSKISKEIEMSGQNVRKYYQRRLPSDPSKDYYFMLRNTPNTEALIVEYGFLDSPEDDVSQIKNNWKTYAEAVVKALANYIGVPYSKESEGDYYIVKSGDTLWSIASKNNTTVDELKKLNNLTSNLLTIGQKLLVKEQANDKGDYYTVKSGDTLYGIAKKYNTTIDKIKSLNNLNSNTLSIGQKLYIGSSSTNITPVDANTYIVKSGDTLWSIASKNNTTVNELKSLNNLTSNTLSIGQVLKLPSNNYSTYKVVSGDTLYGIARRYNTTVADIIKLNNLTSNSLSIGQILLISNK